MPDPTFLAWLKTEVARWAALPDIPSKPFANLAFSGISGGEDALVAHDAFLRLDQPPNQGWREEVSQEWGHRQLRAEVARLYGAASPDHVLIVAGATQANFLVLSALRALYRAETPALVDSPGYGPLFEVPRYLDFPLLPLHRRLETGFGLEHDPAARTTPAIAIISNPHNPSGVLVPREGIAQLAQHLGPAGAVVVDETFLFPGEPSAAGLHHPRIITMGSLSKTFGLGFLKAGWIIACGDLLEKLRDLWTIGFNIGSKITESLGAEVLRHRAAHDRRARELSQTNLALVAQTLDALQARGLLQWQNPGQGSIAFPKLMLGGKPAIWNFYQRALERHRLTLLPGHWFDPFDLDRAALDTPADHPCHHHIRIGFGAPTEQVRLGLERLREAVEAARA